MLSEDAENMEIDQNLSNFMHRLDLDPEETEADTFDPHLYFLEYMDRLKQQLYACTRKLSCKCERESECECDSDLYVPVNLKITEGSNSKIIVDISANFAFIKKHTQGIRLFTIDKDEEKAFIDIKQKTINCIGPHPITYKLVDPVTIISDKNYWSATCAFNYLLFE